MALGKVESLEQQVQALSGEELAQFRAWFLEFDWALWDARLEHDVRDGRLDALADAALRDHAAGKTTPLWGTGQRRASGPAIMRPRRQFATRQIKHTST